MISRLFCANAGVASPAQSASRINVPRFIFSPERAKLRAVYEKSIMGHKILILCAIVVGLAPAAALATYDGASDARAAPIVEAMLTVGTRYRYGGDSPETGFDCSGLVTHVFQSAWGVALPRSVEGQSRVGKPVRRLVELQPGDLVFYNTTHR